MNITQNTTGFIIYSIIDAIRNQLPKFWEPLTQYVIGDVRVSNNKLYIAGSNGESGRVAPFHSSGLQSDGGVAWIYVSDARHESAINKSLYLGLASAPEWADNDNPPEPEVDLLSQIDVFDSIQSLFKLGSNDIRIGLFNHEWETGTVYSQFEDDVTEYGGPFYVIVDKTNIYKCLDNNGGGASTVKPTGRSTSLIRGSDNYVWKYMGSINPFDKDKFNIGNYLPISVVDFDSEVPEQWGVQKAAKPNSISSFRNMVYNNGVFIEPIFDIVGEGTDAFAAGDLSPGGLLEKIYITTPGTGYTKETYCIVKENNKPGTDAEITLGITETGNVSFDSIINNGINYDEGATLIIVGDGTGATGTLTLASGSVTGVTIDTVGSGYTWAKAFIIPGTSGAVAKAILAPVNGHGANIIKELNANALLISKKILYSQYTPYILDTLTYRRIFLISDPDSVKKYAESYIGPAHSEYDANPNNLNKYKKRSGNILYIENIPAMSHVDLQSQTIKISIIF